MISVVVSATLTVCRHMALTAVVLHGGLSAGIIMSGYQRTYRKPMENITHRPTFVLIFSCMRAMIGIGSSMTSTSVEILQTTEKRMKVGVVMQLEAKPGEWFQPPEIGLQPNMFTRKMAVQQSVVMAIEAMQSVRKRGCGARR